MAKVFRNRSGSIQVNFESGKGTGTGKTTAAEAVIALKHLVSVGHITEAELQDGLQALAGLANAEAETQRFVSSDAFTGSFIPADVGTADTRRQALQSASTGEGGDRTLTGITGSGTSRDEAVTGGRNVPEPAAQVTGATGQGFTAAQIETDLKNGVLQDAEAIRALESLGIAQAAAVVRHWRTGGTGTIVGPASGQVPQQTGAADGSGAGDGAGDDLPRPDPIFTPAVTSANLPAREDIFGTQGLDDANLRRRLIAGAFGGSLTPTGQLGANIAFNRFAAQEPISNFGPSAVPRQEAFGNFLADRPTAERLSGGIQDILGGGSESEFFARAFPDARSVISAGIQPRIQSLTPHLRGGIENILTQRGLTSVAQAPEQFSTQQQIFDLLKSIDSGFGGF